MSNNTIEETLIGIEQNLEKLESARRQVLDVTQSGKQIITTMVQLTRSVDEVYKIINLESNSFGNNLDSKKYEFNTRIDQIGDGLNSSILSFLAQLNSFTTTVSDSIDLSVANASEATRDQIARQDIAFDKHLSNIDHVNKLLENFKNNLSHYDLKSELRPLEDKIDLNQLHAISSFDNGIRTIQQHLIEVAKTENEQLIKFHSDQIQALALLKEQQKQNAEADTKFMLAIKSDQANAVTFLSQRINESIQEADKKNKLNNYVTWALLVIIILLKIVFK